jgi:hypothetical protein
VKENSSGTDAVGAMSAVGRDVTRDSPPVGSPPATALTFTGPVPLLATRAEPDTVAPTSASIGGGRTAIHGWATSAGLSATTQVTSIAGPPAGLLFLT